MQIRSALERPASATASRMAALVLALALAATTRGAWANPLTEVPGVRPAPAADEASPARRDAAEAAEARAVNPSATAIIRSLAPFVDGNPGAGAVRPRPVAPSDGGPPLRVDARRSVDLTVFFAYGSADLTPEARIQLEPLGEALRSRDLAGFAFLIAGHTDAAGGLGYNRRLSLARARTVKSWLLEAYGIDPARLRVHGWGPSRPKDPSSPLSRVNRRVEVTLIAPVRTSLLPAEDPGWSLSCPPARLADPRRHLIAFELDDFDAAPTRLPCTE